MKTLKRLIKFYPNDEDTPELELEDLDDPIEVIIERTEKEIKELREKGQLDTMYGGTVEYRLRIYKAMKNKRDGKPYDKALDFFKERTVAKKD